MSDETELRSKLESSVGPVFYSDMAAHIRRGGLLVVAPELALVDAAVAIARDDSAAVSGWLERAQLRRPTPAEVSQWEKTDGMKFDAVVVQPFVLVQLQSRC